MIGWLGATYPWVKAVHVVFVIFWMAGLFMLPRHLVYHRATAPGSEEDRLWVAREATLRRMILTPSLVAVWVLGLALAFNLGWQPGWLHAKLLLVVALTGYHGWMVGLSKRLSRGERPLSDRRLRALNEAPAVATVLIVVLAEAKPF